MEALLGEAAGHESIDRVGFAGWHGGFFHPQQAPVRLIDRAGFDPALEQVFFGVGELQVRIGRRHHLVGVGRDDALPGQGIGELAGDDGRFAVVAFRKGAFRNVESQLGLAGLGVEAVAGEAAVGEQRADVAVEIRRGFRADPSQRQGDDQQDGLIGERVMWHPGA